MPLVVTPIPAAMVELRVLLSLGGSFSHRAYARALSRTLKRLFVISTQLLSSQMEDRVSVASLEVASAICALHYHVECFGIQHGTYNKISFREYALELKRAIALTTKRGGDLKRSSGAGVHVREVGLASCSRSRNILDAITRLSIQCLELGESVVAYTEDHSVADSLVHIVKILPEESWDFIQYALQCLERANVALQSGAYRGVVAVRVLTGSPGLEKTPTPSDQYSLLEEIAKGGFGKVYLARLRGRGGDKFVVKVTSCSSNDPRRATVLRRHAVREVYLLRNLRNSPFIVSFCAGIQAACEVWCVMELCEHGNVYDVTRRNAEQRRVEHGLTEVCPTAYLLRSVLRALQFLHNRGIYHGDVKGENVLITSTGAFKLCDFGTAHKFDEPRHADDSPGTYYFLAPEVIEEGSSFKDVKRSEFFGPKIDIWALGMMVMQLVHLEIPWKLLHRGGGGIDFQNAVLLGDFKELSFLPEIPVNSQLKRFTFRCLVQDPASRPSAGSLLDDEFVVSNEGLSGGDGAAVLSYFRLLG